MRLEVQRLDNGSWMAATVTRRTEGQIYVVIIKSDSGGATADCDKSKDLN
jgi:hypothetical protein